MDKVVFITGGSSGIGAATARALVSAGARVALFARSAEKLESLRDEISPSALVFPGDVTVQSDLNRAVDGTLARFGRIDAVLANAGQFAFEDLVTGDPDAWARMVDVNINGVLRTVRAVLPALVDQGAGQVILTASIAGRSVYPDSSIYAGTKHFLYGWAVGLRKQVQKHGISVCVIAPGYVLNELWGETAGSSEQRAQVDAGVALTSEDIADAIVFMLGRPAHVNIADMLVLATRQEVPHATTVFIDKWEETRTLIRMYATIMVERDGQKAIVIGSKGAMLKQIGTLARQEMESLFGIHVFLDLHVKVESDWREKPAFLNALDWRTMAGRDEN